MGLRSQPREAAVCPVMGGQALRCISSREGYSIWHPSHGGDRAAFGVLGRCGCALGCLWGTGLSLQEPWP